MRGAVGGYLSRQPSRSAGYRATGGRLANQRLPAGSALVAWQVSRLAVGWLRPDVLGVPVRSEPVRWHRVADAAWLMHRRVGYVVAPHDVRAGFFAFRMGGTQYLIGTDPVRLIVTQEVTSALNFESTNVSGCLKFG